MDVSSLSDKARGDDPEVNALRIAQSVLRAWQAPALVSAVEINALRGMVTRSENTTVRDLENARVIAWSQDDRALPMPLDFQDAALAADFVKALDQETLRITGMPAERYRLTIDGELIGVFHRDQLDAGLQLALLPTPMWKQAMAVHALTKRHEEFSLARRRLLENSTERRNSSAWKAEWEALDAAESELNAEQRSRAVPRTHDYELEPVDR